ALDSIALSDKDLRIHVLADDQWHQLEKIMNFFQPFKEITTIMSSSTYPTLSTTIPLYNTLIDHAKEIINAENIISIKAAAEKCKEK
ncbi:11634_t:CDS:1, partial [Diversispora eburnea]